MGNFQRCDVPTGLKHHVYVLFSAARDNFVKVGRANSIKRIRSLQKMHYANINDWQPYRILHLDTSQAAVAVEAMTHARLVNQGYRVRRFGWTRLPDMKACWADECFHCTPDHAFLVVQDMATVYSRDIA